MAQRRGKSWEEQHEKRVAWWLANRSKRSVHDKVFAHVDSFQRYSIKRRDRAINAARRVNADLSGFGVIATHEEIDFSTFAFNKIFNGFRSIASKVTATRVMPFIVTEGGDFHQREAAEEFNKTCVGILEEQGVYDDDFAYAEDALTYEFACAKATRRFNEVCIERTRAWEWLFDPLDTRNNWRGLRTIYHSFLIDKDQLLAIFPDLDDDQRAKVLLATLDKADKNFYGDTSQTNLVRVIEAWHLPSGPTLEDEDGKKSGPQDGRHFIGIRNVTFLDEEYHYETFPLAVMYQIPPQEGVSQVSFVERNINAQRTVDRVTNDMAESVGEIAKTRVWVKAGVEHPELDNQNLKIYQYRGNDVPLIQNAEGFAPSTMAFLQMVSDGITSNEGISDMSSQGQLPQGLRDASGKALVVADDTFSEQLSPFMHSRQQFYCRLGELALQIARECAAENEGYVVSIVDGKEIRRVKFKDMDIGEGNYKILVQPASYLSKSPSAKYKQLSEMRANGDITPNEFRKLMGVPDLVAANELDTAMQDVIDKTIYQILSKGMQAVAQPFDDLNLIISRGTKAYHLARVKDLPSDRQERLLEYVRSAYDEQQRQAPKPAPPPMPPPVMGPAGPMMPPDGMAPDPMLPPGWAPPPMPPPGGPSPMMPPMAA